VNPALGLALAGVFVTSLTLALRAGSGRRALAVAVLGAAAGLGLLRQFPLAAALAMVGIGLWRRSASGAAPTAGQSSEVRTDGLAMTLDHDSGRMDGEVLSGPFAGRRLSDLAPAELQALLAQFEDDMDSLALLTAWLERTGAETQDAPPATDAATMSRDEAYRVLGLEPGASADEVREAYRRLMRRVHPDLGGSGALAAMINAAKQVLDPGGAEDGA
jgi:hypothetical protein